MNLWTHSQKFDFVRVVYLFALLRISNSNQMSDVSLAADGGKTATYYGNRSAAFLMLQHLDKAIEDCKTAVQLDPKFGKVKQHY